MMLEAAEFRNFTTIPNGEWHFAGGLNVIIGENGLGKTHVLKAIYALLKVNSTVAEPTKAALEKAYADKLMTVMRPESLGRLVKRKQGRERCELALRMKKHQQNCAIGFASNAKTQVEVIQVPQSAESQSPVYLPTRELVTLCPWFLSLYDNYHVEFEETWRDTVSLLGSPTLKGPREKRVARFLEPLEAAMGGKVQVDSGTGRFYLQIPGEGRMEMPLVAEGLRKLATLARLISTGNLLEQGYLFWDEPETNLNPKIIKSLAASILALAASGVQVFIATHSLFLLREFEMLLAQKPYRALPSRWFALSKADGEIRREQSGQLDEIQALALLDEELAQSDRFLRIGEDA